MMHILALWNDCAIFNDFKNVFTREEIEVAMKMKDESGKLPIHYAAACGNAQMIKEFKEFDGQDSEGNYAIHYASFFGFRDIFKDLVATHEIHLINNLLQNPLHTACLGNKDTIVVSIIASEKFRNEQLYALDINGNNSLFYAIITESPRILKMISAHYTQSKNIFELQNYDDENILHFAVKSKCVKNFEDLVLIIKQQEEKLNIKFDKNLKNKKNQTPLHILATQQSKTEIFQLFFDNYRLEIDINAQDVYDRTALHYLCLNRKLQQNRTKRNLEFISYLLNFDELNLMDDYSYQNPLDLAIYYKDEEVVKLITSKKGINLNEYKHDLKIKRKSRNQEEIAEKLKQIRSEYKLARENAIIRELGDKAARIPAPQEAAINKTGEQSLSAQLPQPELTPGVDEQKIDAEIPLVLATVPEVKEEELYPKIKFHISSPDSQVNLTSLIVEKYLEEVKMYQENFIKFESEVQFGTRDAFLNNEKKRLNDDKFRLENENSRLDAELNSLSHLLEFLLETERKLLKKEKKLQEKETEIIKREASIQDKTEDLYHKQFNLCRELENVKQQKVNISKLEYEKMKKKADKYARKANKLQKEFAKLSG